MSTILAFWPLAAAAIAGIVLVVVLRRPRVREMLSGAGRVTARPRSTIAATYDGVARQLAKAGISRATGVTPRELAKAVSAQGKPGATELSELTELYYAAEWGRRADPAAEARAVELATSIKRALAAS